VREVTHPIGKQKSLPSGFPIYLLSSSQMGDNFPQGIQDAVCTRSVGWFILVFHVNGKKGEICFYQQDSSPHKTTKELSFFFHLYSWAW
jgi:hypothetical protein